MMFHTSNCNFLESGAGLFERRIWHSFYGNLLVEDAGLVYVLSFRAKHFTFIVTFLIQASAIWRVDNAIHWIHVYLYLVDSAVCTSIHDTYVSTG